MLMRSASRNSILDRRPLENPHIRLEAEAAVFYALLSHWMHDPGEYVNVEQIALESPEGHGSYGALTSRDVRDILEPHVSDGVSVLMIQGLDYSGYKICHWSANRCCVKRCRTESM